MSDWENKKAPKGATIQDNTALVGAVGEIVERLGYECVHVSIKTDSGRPRLQILIDSLGGINTDDCETVSKSVNRMLDAVDESGEKSFSGLEGQYYLEVSSPGLERPLFTPAHYERFIESEVRIQLSKPLEGRKTVTGKILSLTSTEAQSDAKKIFVTVYVEAEEREVTIPFEDIKNGRLVFRGFEPSEPKKSGRTKRTR